MPEKLQKIIFYYLLSVGYNKYYQVGTAVAYIAVHMWGELLTKS